MVREISGRFISVSAVLIFCVVSGNAGSRVNLTDSGYTGVVVAFAPEVDAKDSEKLIANVQELFINASSALVVATKGKAQFSEITLLVPRSWPTLGHYQRASFETFAEADVRVDWPNPNYGDGPYTLQPLLCGSHGMYIHLTPGYLLHLKTNSTTTFGDPGKTLVHEWAHFRYGVFDEFGYRNNRQYPLFYYDSHHQKVVPNYCANDGITGKYWNTKKDSECIIENGWPSDDCIFKPDAEQNSVTSSLNSYHFLKNVNVFCDGSSRHPHNARAPNKHNTLCNGRSAWDVIEANSDFKTRRLRRSISTPVKPTFKIVQAMEPTFSLVVDVSTSMNLPLDYSKRQMLTDVISRWLSNEVPKDAAVGLITFNETAVERWPMSKLKDEQERQQLLKTMPARASGYTCIGCGLQLAMTQLFNYRRSFGGTIILVTDGEENRRPFVWEIEAELIKYKVRVISIAFSESASHSLETIAEKTEGKVFFVSVKAGVQALGAAFFESLSYQVTNIDYPIKVHDERYNAENKLNYVGNFTVDSTLGNDTVVNFVYLNKDDIETISINGPETEISTKDKHPKRGQRVIFVDADKLIKFRFSYLKPGKYFYVIFRNKLHQQDVTVTVTSMASQKLMKPITTRCWTEKELSVSGMPRFIIFAEVKQGMNPVIKASVVAKIQRPDDNGPVFLELFDNGSGAPDVTENDGIYSRYFTRFAGKGRYTVKAQITDNGIASIQESGFLASSAMPVISDYMAQMRIYERKTGVFERVVEGGSIDLLEQIYTEDRDLLPPSKVCDLRVDSVTADGVIQLQWTAPGDDFDYGQASRYEFYYSNRWEDVDRYFNGTKLVLNMNPRMAGHEETLILDSSYFDINEVYFFAMKSYDDANLDSPMSNIAQSLPFKPLSTFNSKSDKTTVVVYSVIATLFLSLIAVVSVVCCRKRKKSQFR